MTAPGAPRSGMRPFGATISLEDVRAILAAHARPLTRTTRVALGDAAGRAMAADLRASADVPPFARAAMDGYAVVAADTAAASRAHPVSLRCVARVFTGQVPTAPVSSGTCVEIATGAPLPDGADAVVMVEDTTPGPDGTVHVLSAVAPQQHVGRRGADIAAGHIVLRTGDVLTPARIGAAAATGAEALEVIDRPRVALLSTGNEVVAPGAALGPGQIYDINRASLAAIVATHGGVPLTHPAAPDTLDGLARALDASLADADVVVVSGGSSVGERDLLIDVLARRGTVHFHGMAVKPGKPTAFATVDGRPVFGMPGNPTSCLSNAYILLVPFLRQLAGLPPYRPHVQQAPLARRVVSAAGRHQFYTVRLEGGQAVPAFKGSGDITSMALADGYIEIPTSVEVVEAGTLVDVTLF